MTDKFVVGSNEIGEIIVTDVETDRVYRYNDISKFFGLIRLLNEQQATIDELDQENADLLGARIKAQEEWEKCTDKLKAKIVEQQATIEQLRTQLLICQQSNEDDGRFQVWEVPPIPKGMRITLFTTSDGEKDE